MSDEQERCGCGKAFDSNNEELWSHVKTCWFATMNDTTNALYSELDKAYAYISELEMRIRECNGDGGCRAAKTMNEKAFRAER